MEAFLKGAKAGTSGVKSTRIAKEGSNKSDKTHSIPTPWVEKYRPKCVDEVVYQEEVVAVLKKSLYGADLPNLLFYGPPGTGKTSTILAIARELFGDIFRSRVLELNASDERGIQVIRDKVKTFAQQTASSVRPDGKPCPAFKIIILDEADSMTNAAQAALRRTMEKETKSTRFCLICNYVSRIIEPLTSRCSKFRFKPLLNDLVISRLKMIAEEENVKYNTGVLESIVEISEGDLRKAITLLQSAYRLKGNDSINVSDMEDIGGIVPLKWIRELVSVCQTDSYERLEVFITDLINEGYTASQVISQLHDFIIEDVALTDKQKSAICERLAICDKRLLDGADEYLQLMDLSSIIMEQICHSPG